MQFKDNTFADMLFHWFSCQKMQFAHFLVNVLLACGFGSGIDFEFVLFMMGRLGEATVTTESSLSKGQAHSLQNNTLPSRGQLWQLCLKLSNNVPEIISVSGSDKEGLSCQLLWIIHNSFLLWILHTLFPNNSRCKMYEVLAFESTLPLKLTSYASRDFI